MGCKQLLTIFCALFFLFSGCKKLDPKIEIPSYININGYSVNYSSTYTNGGPGTANHNFTDVQLFVNNKALGTYPIPCNIPVIADGQAEISVNPVIKTNGVSSIRSEYPFMKLYQTTAQLSKGQSTTINPVFDYFSTINFKWTEDFEGSGYSIIGATSSDTCFRRVSTEKFEGSNSLEIKLHNGYSQCTVKSSAGYPLPAGSKDIYLELNYKATQDFEVGVYAGSMADQRVAGGVNGSATWKKIYIYLTPVISTPPYYNYYSIYFNVFNKGGTPQVNIDNIKLINN